MRKQTITNAIEIIQYAVNHNVSLSAASTVFGYASTYVSNAKADSVKALESEKLDQKDYDSFMSAYEEYLNTNNFDSNNKPNINIAVEGDFKEFGNTDVTKTIEGSKTSIKETNNYSEITSSSDRIKSVNDLLNTMGVDKSLWEVKSQIVNTWETTAFNDVDGIKTAVPHTNYQVKARLEKIKEEADARNVAEVFKELVKEYKPPVVQINPNDRIENKTPTENNLLEINLFDLHIGKLGWAGEVGENYDTKIAIARFQDAMRNLLKRAEGFEYSRILFPIGNDFFNSDNQFNTTSKGTPQDEDVRWQKTFKMGCKLIADGINMLKATGVPVDVLVIPGNHDFERSFYLGTVMEAWFDDDEMVDINNSASPRKYYEFGQVLIGLTHGNEEKEASLPLLMASEKKEAWGRTTFHEWHLGHFHKKRNVKYAVFDKGQMLNEDLGVTVRYLSSLSGTEEWHFKKGYVACHKAGEAFIWNDESGMVGHLNFNFMDYDREH